MSDLSVSDPEDRHIRWDIADDQTEDNDSEILISSKRCSIRSASIVFGVIRILLAIVTIVLELEARQQGSFIANYHHIAIWAGIPCMVAGCLGVASGICVERCLLLTHAIISMIAGCVFPVLHICFGAGALQMDNKKADILPGWASKKSEVDSSLMLGVTVLAGVQIVLNLTPFCVHHKALKDKQGSASRQRSRYLRHLYDGRPTEPMDPPPQQTAVRRPSSTSSTSSSVESVEHTAGRQQNPEPGVLPAENNAGPPPGYLEAISSSYIHHCGTPHSSAIETLPPSYETVMKTDDNRRNLSSSEMVLHPESVCDNGQSYPEETTV